MESGSSLRQRLYVAGVLGGLAVMAGLVLVVFRYGGRDSSPPPLAKHPNLAIAGAVLFVNDNRCIVRADASGATRDELYCFLQPPPFVSWLDAQTVVFSDQMPAAVTPDKVPSYRLTALDVTTRKVRDAGIALPPDRIFAYRYSAVSVQGEQASIDEDGHLFIVRDGVRTKVADLETPRYGGPQPLIWSPDGQWLLLRVFRDGDGELWIVSRDGKTTGTLARGVQGESVSWWIDGKGYSPSVEGLPK